MPHTLLSFEYKQKKHNFSLCKKKLKLKWFRDLDLIAATVLELSINYKIVNSKGYMFVTVFVTFLLTLKHFILDCISFNKI